jgi:hypothetical protein
MSACGNPLLPVCDSSHPVFRSLLRRVGQAPGCSVSRRWPSLNSLLFCVVLLFITTSNITAVERVEGPLKCAMGRDYWLGFPHGYDPQKTYWLVAALTALALLSFATVSAAEPSIPKSADTNKPVKIYLLSGAADPADRVFRAGGHRVRPAATGVSDAAELD